MDWKEMARRASRSGRFLLTGPKLRSRRARLIRRSITLLGLAYLALIAFPEPLFAYHLDHGPFRVYSDAPIDPTLPAVLDSARALLARSPLDDPSMVHRIYICNERWRRRLLIPQFSSAFGVTYPGPLRRNTFLNRSDSARDLVFRDATDRDHRPLSAVIAHERVHALLGRRRGDLEMFFTPTWKAEGYCEAVAGSPSFDPAVGKTLIRAGVDEGSPSFRYFRHGLMFRQLIEDEGLTVDRAFADRADEDEVLARLRARLERP